MPVGVEPTLQAYETRVRTTRRHHYSLEECVRVELTTFVPQICNPVPYRPARTPVNKKPLTDIIWRGYVTVYNARALTASTASGIGIKFFTNIAKFNVHKK